MGTRLIRWASCDSDYEEGGVDLAKRNVGRAASRGGREGEADDHQRDLDELQPRGWATNEAVRE